ncbi:hypothetical protein AJ80_09892 [Polytolypa hystricis UAMH7299]|uniref:Uncharacterized protein n=1 Tax=Polytolypa hystricis (strain UAMH7299) TaxID=1447883 RepID=A0A2B7WGQ7_POLH7|nr:hypothetical protein AJ80_09892 [Polytolypa hystricis UAMH7299]
MFADVVMLFVPGFLTALMQFDELAEKSTPELILAIPPDSILFQGFLDFGSFEFVVTTEMLSVFISRMKEASTFPVIRIPNRAAPGLKSKMFIALITLPFGRPVFTVSQIEEKKRESRHGQIPSFEEPSGSLASRRPWNYSSTSPQRTYPVLNNSVIILPSKHVAPGFAATNLLQQAGYNIDSVVSKFKYIS